MKVIIYAEHNKFCQSEQCLKHYPKGIHGLLKDLFEKEHHEVKTFTMDNINQLDDNDLSECDVMLWWGHTFHSIVNDELVEKVVDKVHCGMGFIALHSSHLAKPFKRLMGTPCTLKWREANENERLWVINPTHPIAQGLNDFIDIEHEEMYGEPFAIPTPDELVFVGWFKGGNVFRSGCCYQRGYGKVFYFQPGHESYNTYNNKEIQKILINALNWAKPVTKVEKVSCENTQPLEKI